MRFGKQFAGPGAGEQVAGEQGMIAKRAGLHQTGVAARIVQLVGQVPTRGVAQSGSAPALGAGSRRFESYRPDWWG